MIILILILILFAIALLFLIIIIIKRRSKFKEKLLVVEDKEDYQEKSSKGKTDKNDKLTKISEIVAETQSQIDADVKKKMKYAEAHYKHKEIRKIRKGERQYDTFISKLQSAMPSTEVDRLQDLKELKNVIGILESYDQSYYEVPQKKYDAGVGMFYDKMSRRFKSIISETKLNNYKLVPIQRLKYHIFHQVKNLKNTDILPILNAMKDTKMLGDVIEINSVFHVLIFSDEKFTFSLPERVLLTFAYDKDLTFEKLLELTEWNREHANGVIKSLSERNIVMVYDDKIIVGGFGQLKDREEWGRIIKERMLDDKIAEAKKDKLREERKKKLEKHLEKVREVEITEPEPKEKKKEKVSEKERLKEEQEIKDKDALVGAMEALDGFMPLESEASAKSLEKDEPSLLELISEDILRFHEKFSVINGGFVQYEKIKGFIEDDLGKVPDDLVQTVMSQLKELQMIQGSLKIGKNTFYLFNDITLSKNEKNLIKFAIDKEPMKKEDLNKELAWDEEKTLLTMKDLQEKGILRIEKDKIIINGIIQKN
jgi:hypothetical protein